MNATPTIKLETRQVAADRNRRRRIKLAIFCAALILSVAGFVAIDYFYSAAVLGSAVSGGSHGLCFSRDPVRAFAFQPNCSCIRPWLGSSYEFDTNNLGFRDEQVRDVPLVSSRPRVLILGDSAPEGMTSWQDSFIGRVAANFPQYEFLNGSVEGYSPSNYLNTARMVTQRGVGFDEAIVFLDISDAQDEAAFFHDKDGSGAVATASGKRTDTSEYSQARLWINNHLLLTNDVFQFFERTLIGLGWYHLDLGHGGNEFDLERSAWTYRKVSDTDPYETGYAPLGLEGGIAKEKSKMDDLWRELAARNIPVTVVVYPWPAQLAHDSVDSRQVRIWQDWCQGRCKRFIDLFPAFFAIKDQCPRTQPGCWYSSHFIFGDTHYNSAGDAVVAGVISRSLAMVPVSRRGEPQQPAAGPSSEGTFFSRGVPAAQPSVDRGMFLRILLYAVALLLGLIVMGQSRSRVLRQTVLLLVSYALYVTWGTWFLAALLASTVVNFLLGRRMQRRQSAGVLWSGLAFNVALLGVFKYLPGVALSFPIAPLQKFAHIALPLGISFWSFQAMSYLFDLYRGEELDPSFIEFALYMAFFPVTISGPICRLPEMLGQFRSEQAPARSDIATGLARIATGVLMMAVAQLLGRGSVSGQGINNGFDQLTNWGATDVWCLAIGYGLQVFFDFAGYTHVAIGAAKMMGFALPENFARPFASTTPSIFWTRWHMSLSFWIRDYVFLPLAMFRREDWWRKSCLLLAMVLFGLWHGATIPFILFGCYHGVLLIAHRLVQEGERHFNWQPTVTAWSALSWVVTTALISLGWIFFRATSATQAKQMFSAVLSPASYLQHSLHASLYAIVLGIAAAYALALRTIDWLEGYARQIDASVPSTRAHAIAIIAHERWLWLAPMWTAATVLALTMMTSQTHAANVFLYRSF